MAVCQVVMMQLGDLSPAPTLLQFSIFLCQQSSSAVSGQLMLKGADLAGRKAESCLPSAYVLATYLHWRSS